MSPVGKTAAVKEARLSCGVVRQADELVFYSELLSFEIADQSRIRQRAVKFLQNHHLKGCMIRPEFFNVLLHCHRVLL